MTRAFAPLIIASKGRITTIGSISGILSTRDLGVYSMSKHAVEAFGDSLALQMEPHGVQVSIVEPGNYNTEIGKSAATRMGAETRLADRSKYRTPEEVADTVARALFESIRKAIQELVQLNEGHLYTYDREALVRMLDEALATARPALAPVASE